MKQTSKLVLDIITKHFPESRSYLQLLLESLISLLAGFYEGMLLGAFGNTGLTLNPLST